MQKKCLSYVTLLLLIFASSHGHTGENASNPLAALSNADGTALNCQKLPLH